MFFFLQLKKKKKKKKITEKKDIFAGLFVYQSMARPWSTHLTPSLCQPWAELSHSFKILLNHCFIQPGSWKILAVCDPV